MEGIMDAINFALLVSLNIFLCIALAKLDTIIEILKSKK